jgi:hypothetical protein
VTVSLSLSLRADAKARSWRWRGIAHDVTETRRLESHRGKVGKMEAVGRLAGGLAHDSTCPRSNGYSELALMKLPDESPWRGLVEEIHAPASGP